MATKKKIIKKSVSCFLSIAQWGKATKINLPANKEFTLTIDYPLDNPVNKIIKTGKSGMDFVDIVNIIVIEYEKIYEDPDKYGVWGHEIYDLSLEGINVNFTKKTIKIDVGS